MRRRSERTTSGGESRTVAVLVSVGLAVLFAAPPLGAALPEIYPPHSSAYGRTLGEWAAEWARWVALPPTPKNPIVDPDGSACLEGQSCPVFFLAGNIGGTTVRRCTVPCGRPLFFPILNYVAWAEEPDRPGDCPADQPEKCVDLAGAFVEGVTALDCEIDGEKVPNLLDHREVSPFFDFVVPADNPFGTPEGKVDKAVADGYWLMVAPLSPGAHTVRFKGEHATGFSLDVTYDLTVERCDRPTVLPPHSKVFGKTLGEWSGEWWRWALAPPVERNPILDPDGRHCHEGQSGPVHFIAGTAGGSALRSCTVPCGKLLFLSIGNVVAWTQGPGTDDCPGRPEDCVAAVRAHIDQTCVLECEIDGLKIGNLLDHREESPFFDFEVPAENVFGMVPGKYKGVSDGYWLMLTPPTPGTHVLRFRSKNCGNNFETELVLCFTVEGCPEPKVFPPHSQAFGKSIGEWSSELWRWLAAIPAAESPALDEDGTHCRTRQSGPVFYLVHAGGAAGVKTCRVPCGKALLNPNPAFLAWGEQEGVPGDCPKDRPEVCVDAAKRYIDNVAMVEVVVDGAPLAGVVDHRETSPFFSFDLPEGNIFGLPAGRIDLAVSDGYWFLFEPLPPGTHVLHFKSLVRDPLSPAELIYCIEVEPCGFRRGEANGDALINIADPIFTLSYLFLGGDPVLCPDAADSNDDGLVNIADAIYALSFLFLGGPPPPAPGPDACGEDLAADELAACDAACAGA